MNDLREVGEHYQSSWIFYTVAAVLGLSFSAVLLMLAWNNSLESEERAFAYELVAFDETARTQARAADSALQGFVRLLRVSPNVSSSEAFSGYCQATLRDQPYVSGVAWYGVSGRNPALLELTDACAADTSRRFPSRLSTADTDPSAADLRATLEVDAGIPISLGDHVLTAAEYAIARRVILQRDGATRVAGIVILFVDAQNLLGKRVDESAMPFELVLESEGVGGRHRLFRRNPVARETDGVIKQLKQSSQIRFEHYTLRLNAQRALGWGELDRALLFTALILSTGVTLLLIALARAKEMQTRELAARNRVIEQQVRRQTYELALARDEALTASKVKSDFLASMSHEIRTPLNAIIGMAELLGDTALSKEQWRYVGVFKNAGEALLSLVNDILDLSKIEAGQLVLEEIEFEPRELFEQAADIYALKTSTKGLELAVSVAPEVPVCLVGDPSRMRQIVLNLIANAVKFTAEGEILISAQMSAGSAQDLRLRCTVADSGIGIPADKLESIFGNFTQVDSSTTRKYGGTGLGLAICKRLVEMMAGRIWVESTVGRGSKFSFEVALRLGNPHGVPSVPMPDVAGKSFLVVDDNTTNRLILAQTLGAAGARVVEASSGREAIRALATPRNTLTGFDVILCDSQMPEMDGFTTVEEMLTKGVNPRTVLILTSSNLSEDVARANTLGLGGYLVKPLKRKDLYGALAQLLQKPGGAQPSLTSVTTEDSPRGRILLVEDNSDNRLLVRAYLKNAPYEIEEVENGAEAVLQCRAQRYDLVLMDIQMPVMDGHEATRVIRAYELEAGLSPMPIIALTAHAVKEEIDRSLLAGCTAHMTKPIKKKLLLDLLGQLLAKTDSASLSQVSGQ